MTQTLEERVSELERRVAELEARPALTLNAPFTQPVSIAVGPPVAGGLDAVMRSEGYEINGVTLK